MIAFFVNHPWLIALGWVAVLSLLAGVLVGACLVADKRKQKQFRRVYIESDDWNWPPRDTHLGKTTLGEERRAA